MTKYVRQSNAQKWEGHNEDDFVLNMAEMDLPIYPNIKRSILKRLDSVNNFQYKVRSKQYFEAIFKWYQQRHARQGKLDLTPQILISSPSLVDLLYISVKRCTQKGDGVIFFTPIWKRFSGIISHLQRNPIECSLIHETSDNLTRYHINFADLEQKAKLCKMLVICNPHNPSGRIWTKQQISKILKICEQNNLVVYSDEIMSDLVPEQLRPNFYSLINSNYPKLIVGNSISKAFNMESLKGGYAFIRNKQMREKIDNQMNALSLNLNQFAMCCTEVVYSNEGKEWLKYATSIIENNYNYLHNKVKNTKLIINKFEGSQLIVFHFQPYLQHIKKWFNIMKKQGDKPPQMVVLFLAHHKIFGRVVTDSGVFDNIYTEVRFNIATEQPFFHDFTDKFHSALTQLQRNYSSVEPKL